MALSPGAIAGIIIAAILFALGLTCAVTYAVAGRKSTRPKLIHFQPTPDGHFPVDIVFTWVDGTDPTWLAQRKHFENERNEHFHIAQREPAPHRKDELYYAVKLAEKNLPWLRRIIIVTQRPQKPWWLASTRAEVVHHDEFFMPAVLQPTFNSNTIESQLPYISGLAEHYLVANDDMFVGRELKKSHFFSSKGKPIMRLSNPALYKVLNTAWAKHLMNTENINRNFGLEKAQYIPEHVIYPLVKSIHRQVVELGSRGRPPLSRFRDENSWVNIYAAAIATEPEELGDSIECIYWGAGWDFANAMTKRKNLPHLFCINGHFDDKARAVLDAFV